MKKLLIIAVLLMSAPAFAILYTGNSNWTQAFTTDQYTQGLWHFDEQTGSTTAADASGNQNHGTLVTGFAAQLDPNQLWQPGILGGCVDTTYVGGPNISAGVIRVDQSDTYSVPGNSLCQPDGGQDLTIECWLKTETNTSEAWPRLLSKHTGTSYGLQLMRNDKPNPGEVTFRAWNNSSGPIEPAGSWFNTSPGSGVVPTEQWFHLAVVVDRDSSSVTDTIGFFVNGVQTGLAYMNDCGTYEENPLWILGSHNAASYFQYYGAMDELRISNCLRYEIIPEPSILSMLALLIPAVLRRKK